MAEIPEVFNQPGAAFVLLPNGIKFPPIEKEWQKKPHTFTEAGAHKGNVGVMAGNGYIGLDKDDPVAFEGLVLPSTTMWETRPGRLGLWLRGSDSVAEALAAIGKKPALAQLKLFKDEKACGEIKLQRAYQAIPPSWKKLEDGTRADYRLLDSSPPATITLAKLLSDLQALGITFSSKLEANAARLENACQEARKKRAESDESRTRRYAEAALRDEVLAVAGSSTGNRNTRLNEAAFSLGQFVAASVLSESEVTRELSRAAMSAGLELEEVERTIRSGLGGGAKYPREIPDRFQRADCEELTEGGNATRLERIHGGDLRYNHTHKKWYLWDNGRWKIDANGGAMRLAGDVVGELYHAAGSADGKDARAALASFAKATDTRKGLTNMLALAANRLQFALTADDFDRDAFLLGAENITIDLKTGTSREPRREDRITKTVGARYDKTAQCPLWLKFLDRIFPDNELREYIKRAVGYCLTGSMIEQIFFFCYGQGANGKSVFLATIRAILGEYAKQADFNTFLVQRNEKVRNDLAALAGARVITAIEAEEGGRLSMQVIKSWTGGDPVTARFLFGENFTFQPQGKLWLAANNKPAITERNHAAWRRVRLIPFNVTIPEAEQDKDLEAKLLEELPGILNWTLEGLHDYLQDGMLTPKAVQEATEEYRKENDSIEAFLAECCEIGKLKVCKNADLYGQYQNFCRMSGLTALSQHKFSPEMKNRTGISSNRNMCGVFWKGVDLKPDWKLCSFEDKATSQAEGSKHVDLSQNAQSIEKSPLREDFAHLTNKATPHIDSNLHQSYMGGVCQDGMQGEEGQKLPKKFIETEPTIGPHPRKDEPTPSQRGAAQSQDPAEKGATTEERHPPCKPTAKQDNPGFAKFKAGMAKRYCVLCGEDFSYDLGIHWQGGYICARCHREGPPPEPEKADAQQRFDDNGSKP